jgi:glycine cleavage system aminomethyltransferase T
MTESSKQEANSAWCTPGSRHLDVCVWKKATVDYGHDLDNTDGPDEAGLGFALDLNKPDGFIGKAAVLANKAKGS